MKLHIPVRTLLPAVLLSLAIASVSAAQADAKPKKPVDNGVRCMLRGENTVPGSEVEDVDFVFYLPGETAIVVLPDGRTAVVRCGEDGLWHPARVVPTGGSIVAPLSGIAP